MGKKSPMHEQKKKKVKKILDCKASSKTKHRYLYDLWRTQNINDNFKKSKRMLW